MSRTTQDIVLNDTEREKRYEKNWFFVGTIVVVAINLLLYFVVSPAVNVGARVWYGFVNFDAILQAFLNAFGHLSLQHVLLNMLCFLVCGIYLERKIGTLRLLFMVFVLAFFTSLATTANSLGLGWRGFSGVNYALYFFILVDYVFLCFQKDVRSRGKLILGGVVLALIFVAMCYKGDADGFAMTWYPYDLLNNMGHYSSALVGIIFAFVVKLFKKC